MKTGFLFLLFLSLSSSLGFAQELAYDTPATSPTNTTNVAGLESEPPLFMEFTEGMSAGAAQEDVVLKGKFQLSGPLVRPLKGHGILELPVRLLQLLNPFTKAAVTDQFARVERDAQAWTTQVGWHPGQTGFADDTHHEPQLRLISISKPASR
jgi:hypothetical protein